MKFPKTWVGEQIFKNSVWEEGRKDEGGSRGNTMEEGRGNAKVIGSCDFFIFIFPLLAMMVTNTVLRKSSLEDLF